MHRSVFRKFSFIIFLFLSFSCSSKKPAIDRTLQLNMNIQFFSIDPRIENDLNSAQIHTMLFEGLTRTNPDKSIRFTGAKDCQISEDQLTYTFHLRDASWSNGEEVTANDYETSWKEILSPNFPAKSAHFLYCIKNAEKAKKGLCPLEKVGLQALDSKTLVVTLEKKTPFFLHRLSCYVFFPFKTPQLTNGPFIIDSYLSGNKIILKKNPMHRLANTISLEKIIIYLTYSEAATLDLFTSKKIDLIGFPFSSMPPVAYHSLKNKYPHQSKSIAGTKMLLFNTKESHFKNSSLRKAFSLAISRKEIVGYITQQQEEVPQKLIPSLFYTKANKLYQETNPNQLRSELANPEQAKYFFNQGLKQLKLDKTQLGTISLVYSVDEINHLIAQYLQKVWSKTFDIPIQLERMEVKQLYHQVHKKAFCIAMCSWVAEYFDPMNYLERLQNKDHFQNPTGWEHPLYQYHLNNAQNAQTENSYYTNLLEAEKIVKQEVPVFPLYHWNYTVFTRPCIDNLQISPLGIAYLDTILLKENSYPKIIR